MCPRDATVLLEGSWCCPECVSFLVVHNGARMSVEAADTLGRMHERDQEDEEDDEEVELSPIPAVALQLGDYSFACQLAEAAPWDDVRGTIEQFFLQGAPLELVAQGCQQMAGKALWALQHSASFAEAADIALSLWEYYDDTGLPCLEARPDFLRAHTSVIWYQSLNAALSARQTSTVRLLVGLPRRVFDCDLSRAVKGSGPGSLADIIGIVLHWPERTADEIRAIANKGAPLGHVIRHCSDPKECHRCVSLLLAAGADPNSEQCRGDDGESVLLQACQRRLWDVSLLLVAAGADPNASSISGDTPLLECITSGGREDVAAALLDAGARIDWYPARPRITVLGKSLRERMFGTAERLIAAPRGEAALFSTICQAIPEAVVEVSSSPGYLDRTVLELGLDGKNSSIVLDLLAAGVCHTAVQRTGFAHRDVIAGILPVDRFSPVCETSGGAVSAILVHDYSVPDCVMRHMEVLGKTAPSTDMHAGLEVALLVVVVKKEKKKKEKKVEKHEHNVVSDEAAERCALACVTVACTCLYETLCNCSDSDNPQ
eukprot:m51a1_g9331 hypothetical protein (546) ;mRNA; r:18234-23473